ncbi:MAG TPA: AmmeMemoRadiSam system protein B [Armatimonadota bacterium]|nr:AmmeMemoRadiSam system protein B [Armatimonadota bacterium]
MPGAEDQVRPAAVAGKFYPDEAKILREMVTHLLRNAATHVETVPKGIIAPHAAYAYSGPIAGSAYAALANPTGIKRVVLFGPSHYTGFPGLALSGTGAFETPLGRVAIDRETEQKLLSMPQVQVIPAAHGHEHCLEVQLPFLQQTLRDFRIVALLVGDAPDDEVAQVMESIWGGPETLFVISSDLSHYLDYESASLLDRETADAIEQLRPADILDEQACGHTGVRAFLWAARHHGLQGKTLDLRNSGDTSGRRDHVVGYGAFAFTAIPKG